MPPVIAADGRLGDGGGTLDSRVLGLSGGAFRSSSMKLGTTASAAAVPALRDAVSGTGEPVRRLSPAEATDGRAPGFVGRIRGELTGPEAGAEKEGEGVRVPGEGDRVPGEGGRETRRLPR